MTEIRELRLAEDFVTPVAIAIHVEDASPEELEAGIAAAWRVFGDDPRTLWNAAGAIHRWIGPLEVDEHDNVISGGLIEGDDELIEVWFEAEAAAAGACCAGWDDAPAKVEMEMLYDRQRYASWAARREDEERKNAGLFAAIRR
jgi:hypothetical protein